LAVLALEDQMAQRDLQIGPCRAANAAVTEQHRFFTGATHQRVVDADGAELVDDDRGAVPLRRCEKALQQRGLAGAEKAGDDRDRNARAARAFEPASEWPRLARRKQIKCGQNSISRM
jgi:hypothetical protein